MKYKGQQQCDGLMIIITAGQARLNPFLTNSKQWNTLLLLQQKLSQSAHIPSNESPLMSPRLTILEPNLAKGMLPILRIGSGAFILRSPYNSIVSLFFILAAENFSNPQKIKKKKPLKFRMPLHSIWICSYS